MKTLFLELNEFSYDLLLEGAKSLNLPHLQRMVDFHKSETLTEDTYDKDTLEPWVQWVSIHTATPFQEHQIKHLGDVPHLANRQLWETLSKKNITSGVWGSMNASRAGAKNCLFFLPDPWTFTEKAYPEELNALLNPLRYTSKHYTNKKWGPMFKGFGQFCKFLREKKLLKYLLFSLPSLIKTALKFPKKPFVFISFLDKLSTKLFLKYQKKHQPDFSILFLNSIAHLQHHQWKEGPIDKNSPLAHGLYSLDLILKDLFQEFQEDDLFIVTNALSQINTKEDPPWILYRQIDQKAFLNAIGIQNVKVESHMTHDAHLFFPDESQAKRAKELLQSATIENKPLFHIESYENTPNKLFYKLLFTDKLEKDATFRIQDQTYPFFKFFCPIVQRTGKHIQEGTILSNKPIFPPSIPNHEITKYLEEALVPNLSTLQV